MVGVEPFDHVNVNGGVPVKVMSTPGSGEPEQTLPPPDRTAVGRGLTVTVAEPVPATVQPFESVIRPVIE